MSLLEGSLSGVEALRHLRLDLQARKKVICQFGSKLMVVSLAQRDLCHDRYHCFGSILCLSH